MRRAIASPASSAAVALLLLLPLSAASQTVAAAVTKQSCAERICIKTVRRGRSIVFYGVNRDPHLTITVRLRLQLHNVRAGRDTRRAHVIGPNARVRLFRLRHGRGRWRYRYWTRWMAGDAHARHNPDVAYRLPYARGTRHLISQSCNGRFSHQGRSRYAIDFAMPEGTPIYAARDGRVVALKSDSLRGGPDRAFINDGNYIAIQHSDGTIAYYYHLAFNGVRVRLGEYVDAGALIGRSGNTGFSRGPHLHFAVQKPSSDLRVSQSLPIRFRTADGIVNCPPRLSRPEAY